MEDAYNYVGTKYNIKYPAETSTFYTKFHVQALACFLNCSLTFFNSITVLVTPSSGYHCSGLHLSMDPRHGHQTRPKTYLLIIKLK